MSIQIIIIGERCGVKVVNQVTLIYDVLIHEIYNHNFIFNSSFFYFNHDRSPCTKRRTRRIEN